MQKLLYLLGWFTKLVLLSQNSLSSVFQSVESIVLFVIQLNGQWLKHPIKSLLLSMN